jgi:hypothetical protein
VDNNADMDNGDNDDDVGNGDTADEDNQYIADNNLVEFVYPFLSPPF